MEIGVDLRVLLKRPLTGVGLYTAGLLTELLKSDQHNFYKLFLSGANVPEEVFNRWQSFANVKLYRYNYPNKFLNGSLAFFKKPSLDRLMGSCQIFWFPNLNFWSVSHSCQTIVTIHDLSFERIKWAYSAKMRLWHALIQPKEKLTSAAKIIAVSQHTKKDLTEIYGLAEDKIEVVYPGIEQVVPTASAIQSVKEKYHLPEKFILFLGTLEPRKNVEGVIRAFESLKLPEHHLVIAGAQGWLCRRINRLVNRSLLKEKIRLIDYVLPPERRSLYRLAALLVWPTFYEGFGFPPVEAMAQGCPVVTSANSSLPEATRGAALLINPYNIKEISVAMRMVLEDNDLRQNLIAKGYQVVQSYSWQKSAQEMLKIFELF